jgi:hypothetical protein
MFENDETVRQGWWSGTGELLLNIFVIISEMTD